MIIHGFDVYRMYLAMKLHFSQPKFDYFIAEGKTNAKEKTYQERNDFYFFETLARKHSKEEIQNYLLASFVSSSSPEKIWIGDIKRNGHSNYLVWKKQMDGLSYAFSEDCDTMVDCVEVGDCTLAGLFGFEHTENHRPPCAFKLFVKGKISLETLLICDQVLGYIKDWDRLMNDPLWGSISFKIKKYKPFLSIPVQKYREVLKLKFVPG